MSSLFIVQCVVVLRMCVSSVSVVVPCLHLWVARRRAGGARRPRRRFPRSPGATPAYMLILLPALVPHRYAASFLPHR